MQAYTAADIKKHIDVQRSRINPANASSGIMGTVGSMDVSDAEEEYEEGDDDLNEDEDRPADDGDGDGDGHCVSASVVTPVVTCDMAPGPAPLSPPSTPRRQDLCQLARPEHEARGRLHQRQQG